MIDKDELPLDAVRPTGPQREFLKRMVEVTTAYAHAHDLSDMYFQGHSDQTYFGAYSTKIIRRGAGKFIFGFDRRDGILRFAFPVDVSEPYRLAKSGTGDPTRNRAVIELDDDPSEEIRSYLTDLARRCIQYHYNK